MKQQIVLILLLWLAIQVPLGLVVGVALVVVWSHIPQVTKDIQTLVIAESDNDAAILPAGILLQLHEEIHDAACLRTSIEEVAGLDEDGVFTGPPLTGIDQRRAFKDADERIKVAVDVGNCDHTSGRRDG